MTSHTEISQRFREVLLEGKWVAGTNYKEILTSLTWQQAATTIGTLNSISTLAQHINYYIAGILNVFAGGHLEIKDRHSFDFQPVKSKEDWESVLQELFINAEKFARYLDHMSTEQLKQPFANDKYGSYQRNITAMIEHSYYHLGQISLLKKMLSDNKKSLALDKESL